MDNSAVYLEVIIIDKNEEAIKLISKKFITLDQIKENVQNKRNLSKEEIKYLLFWHEDEDQDKCYLENDEDILFYAKEIYHNYLSLTLHSEVIKEENNKINDNIRNFKPLENINNKIKNINNKERDNDYDYNKNEINIIKYKMKEYDEMLNNKNNMIESLKKKISRLEKENENLVKILKNSNQNIDGNYKKDEIENKISHSLEINEQKIYKKLDNLESSILNKLRDIILQEIKNVKIIPNNSNITTFNDDVNKITKNRNHENIINENNVNIINKNNENIINEYHENITNEYNENIISENDDIIENIFNENIINENKNNGKKIKNYNITMIGDNTNIVTEKEKKEREKSEKMGLQSHNYYEFLQSIFFNKDGTKKSKKFDEKDYQKKISKKFKKLKNIDADYFLEYFTKYKYYFLDPILYSYGTKSDVKKIINKKISLFWDIVNK